MSDEEFKKYIESLSQEERDELLRSQDYDAWLRLEEHRKKIWEDYDREYAKIIDDLYVGMINYEFRRLKLFAKGIDVGDYPHVGMAPEALEYFLAQEEYEKCALVKKFI